MRFPAVCSLSSLPSCLTLGDGRSLFLLFRLYFRFLLGRNKIWRATCSCHRYKNSKAFRLVQQLAQTTLLPMFFFYAEHGSCTVLYSSTYRRHVEEAKSLLWPLSHPFLTRLMDQSVSAVSIGNNQCRMVTKGKATTLNYMIRPK